MVTDDRRNNLYFDNYDYIPSLIIQIAHILFLPESRRSDYDGQRFDPELRETRRSPPRSGSEWTVASEGVSLQTPRRHRGPVQRSGGTAEDVPQSHASIPAAPATRLRHLHS